MLPWWSLLIIAVLAGLVAWLWATTTERNKQSARLLDLGARCKSFESSAGELRSRLTEKEKQVESIRADLQQAREVKTAAEARLQESQTALQQQGKLLEQAKDIFANLRTPSVKGRWGELTLRRVVELAGMSEQCDFEEQVTTDSNESRARPDMIVRLPAGRQVIIDAKAPLDAFQDAMRATSEENRKAAMSRHAQLVRSHMNALSSKTYWNQFSQTPDFVVLFLPGESFFSGALECDRTLIEDGISQRVILATPTTLIALLWAVANGWRWEAIAKNTEAISQLGAQVYDRMNVLTNHLSDIGSALTKAVETYNRAVGSMESRLLPSVRKFKELGATAAEDIATLEPVDQTPRSLPEESKTR
jgi:DNA recombination protein RmuC